MEATKKKYESMEMLFRLSKKKFNYKHKEAPAVLDWLWDQYGKTARRLYYGAMCNGDFENFWEEALKDTTDALSGVKKMETLIHNFKKHYTLLVPAKMRKDPNE